MARQVLTVTIDAEGRDKGKVFVLTEMSASQAEAWATRAMMALMRNNVPIPDDWQGLGLGALAALGLQALGGIRYEDAAPLLAEMMDCVTIQPDPNEPKVTRRLVETDIEDVKTRLFLRSKVFELLTGFSVPAALSARLQ